MIERSGFEDDIAAFDEAMGAGDIEEAKAAISDRFLDALAGIGSADEVRAAIERYREAGAASPCVGGIPGAPSRPRSRRRPSRRRQLADLGAHPRDDRGVLVDAVGARVEQARQQQPVVGRLDARHRGRDLVAEVGIRLPLDPPGGLGVEHDARSAPR